MFGIERNLYGVNARNVDGLVHNWVVGDSSIQLLRARRLQDQIDFELCLCLGASLYLRSAVVEASSDPQSDPYVVVKSAEVDIYAGGDAYHCSFNGDEWDFADDLVLPEMAATLDGLIRGLIGDWFRPRIVLLS